MENLEIRFVKEIRANEESGIVSGTAIIFDTESQDLGGFKEIIKPEAATEEFLRQQDIVMLYNHNEDAGVLARYTPKNQRNSLKFNVDEQGVHFEFKAKKKDSGIVESIMDGDLNACSFGFRCAEGGDKWEKRSDGSYLRTINKFSAIRDFSVVVNAAYEATSVNTRGLDELKQQEELQKQKDKESREKQNEEKEKLEKQNRFKAYYNNIVKKYLYT